MKNTLDWTHTKVTVQDIRKLNKLYALHVNVKEVNTPLFVNEKIFEERIRSYFLTFPVSREQILAVKWNMYITKGKYIKLDESGDVKEFIKEGEEEKYYVSFLEIAGELGTFHNTHKEKEA